jgi:Ca-activated chloride channel family protein
MRFLRPEMANWAAVVPAVIVCWFLTVRLKSRFRERAAITSHLQHVSRLSSRAGDLAVLFASVVALGMLVFAVMRPQLELELQLPEFERHDLILILDRSVSMYSQDIKPSRFNRAIEEIKTFLKKKPESIDRVGLVGFAETPTVLSRLTADQSSLMFYMDWMESDARIFWGTDIGAALKSAVQLSEKDWKKTPKIYVVLSDGEDYGHTLADELTELRKSRTRVHTIGIGGDAEVPITVYTDGKPAPLLDESNKVITTKFSSATLTNIASVTGGRYYRSETGAELTTAMYDIVSFERKLVAWRASVEYWDLYRPALAASALAASFLLLKL